MPNPPRYPVEVSSARPGLNKQRRFCVKYLASVLGFPLLWAGWLHAQNLPPAPEPQASYQGTQTARLTGQVLRDDGAIITGAKITLTEQATKRSTEAATNAGGQFVFQELSPGAYTLSIGLPGFTPQKQSVELRPGQTLDLTPTRLSMAPVSISVDAITPEQLALQQLQTEEHQRLIGVLPNFFVSYNWTAPPLTAKQKFRLSTHNVLDPGNLALVGVVAGVQQASNAFPGYG